MKQLDSTKIGYITDYIDENLTKNSNLKIITDIFSVFAYEKLRTSFSKSQNNKILFKEPIFLEEEMMDVDTVIKEFQLKIHNIEKNLSDNPLEIKLKNELNQSYISKEFSEWIKKNAKIKSPIKQGIIGTKHILCEGENPFFIQGNVDMTLKGLGYNDDVSYDYNSVTNDSGVIHGFNMMFDSIWNNESITKDVTNNFLKSLESLYKENSPETVYYYTLYKLFQEQIENKDDIGSLKDGLKFENTKIWNALYNFQRDAVVGSINKIQKYNGCIIADSVGLGKTFEALAVIRYFELRNERVLVLCPKKLRNNWTSFKVNSQNNMFIDEKFRYDVLNHTDLSRDSGKSGDINLEELYWANYDLIVIDESHNFRNNDARKNRETRYDKLLNKVIKDGANTKVLLLSATPVNNKLKDLKNQLYLITKGEDNGLEDANIDSIESTLRLAQGTFNEWNRQDSRTRKVDELIEKLDYDFFQLLNTISIARSRKHIKKYYDTKDIGDFPKRNKPISLKPGIDKTGAFPELSVINENIENLNLAVYTPMLYVFPNKLPYYEDIHEIAVGEGRSRFKQSDRDKSLVRLMRINLLKRMESSIHSFKLTVKTLLSRIDFMMDAMEKSSDNISLEYEDENLFDDVEVGNKIKVKVSDLDVVKYKRDLKEDKSKLEYLLLESEKVTPTIDLKLEELKIKIKEKINNPINDGNKKIIIFSAYSDTAEYLYDNLNKELKDAFNLNTGLITGNKTINNSKLIRNDFISQLVHFSPRSNKKDNINEELDILIATDCISEGQNLQDCDYLVNYDIHWNPVRIIQRFGRIDRIGSTNKEIQLVNFWPNIELDDYINLEARVRGRMSMLDISATGEDDLLDNQSKELLYRKQQMEQLLNETPDIEDLGGGVSITDLNLDEFFMNLDRFLEANPNKVKNLPLGIHAVTKIDDKVRDEVVEGVIFTFKEKDSKKVDRSNSLYPYHMVYISSVGEVIISNKNPKRILDVYKALCDNKKELFTKLVSDFNKETKEGKDMSKYKGLLDSAVNDILGIEEDKSIKSIFKLGEASSLYNAVSSIKDFELVSFLVIKDD